MHLKLIYCRKLFQTHREEVMWRYWATVCYSGCVVDYPGKINSQTKIMSGTKRLGIEINSV